VAFQVFRFSELIVNLRTLLAWTSCSSLKESSRNHRYQNGGVL